MERKYAYMGVGVVLILIVAYFLFMRPPERASWQKTEKELIQFRNQVDDAPGILNCIGELNETVMERLKLLRIPIEMYRQACLTELTTQGEPIVDDCRLIGRVSGRLELTDACYIRAGITLKDLSQCESVHDPSTCRVKIAAEIKNCTLLTEVVDADDCWQQIALRNNEPKACDNIQESWWRDVCYVNMVKATGDLSLCDKVQDRYFNVTCK